MRRKRRSTSPEEHTQELELSGLLGLSPAEVLPAIFALLGTPIMVPSRAPRDGFCRPRVPFEAWRTVAKGDEPVPFTTAWGVYIVATRSSGRSPQPT